MVAAAERPVVVVIGGPNGAGKSTTAPRTLRGPLAVTHFVNADVIARGLSAFNPESVAMTAGRIMLGRLRELGAQRASFAFETTLASRSFAPWLRELIGTGYEFHLVYMSVSQPELLVQRVADRVQRGGHAVPEDVIRRRQAAGLRNFFDLYRPLSDGWRVYDNSGPEPILVAAGDRTRVMTINEPLMWSRILDAPERWQEVSMPYGERSRISRVMLETREVDEAVRQGVRDALLEHKREGLPVVIWRDGKVVWISAEEALGESDGPE